MGHVEVNVFIMVYPESLFLMTSSVIPRAIVSLLQKFSIPFNIYFAEYDWFWAFVRITLLNRMYCR